MRHLAEPAWLALLALLPLPWYLQRSRPRASWPGLGGFVAGRADWLRLASPLLRSLAIAAMAVALARPQTVGGETRVSGRGVAIVVALDRSSSMNEADGDAGPGAPSKLDAARATLVRFIEGRPDDLIGLVAFARYPDLQCPPTLDHAFLVESAEAVRPAEVDEDGTNLGDAVVWGLDALAPEKLGPAPPSRRLLILLTDGRNQPGVARPADPVEASRLARDLGVTVHTIAIGRGKVGPRAGAIDGKKDGRREDEGPDLDLLKLMATAGGGHGFEAADAHALGEVFRSIDGLEKSTIRGTIRVRYHDEYAPWLLAALAAIGLDRLVAAGRWRRLP